MPSIIKYNRIIEVPVNFLDVFGPGQIEIIGAPQERQNYMKISNKNLTKSIEECAVWLPAKECTADYPFGTLKIHADKKR